jgi:membrane-associated protein
MVLANIISDLTDWLEDVSAEWWFLLVILGIAFFDSVIPIVPSETTVILGGVAAGAGDQSLPLVIASGALGAFLGDNTAYLIGRRFAPLIQRRAERRPKTAARLVWARDQIRKRGGLLLITARFIPGGRTALTVSSGVTHQPWRWFAAWVAVAALIWATYAASLGAIFGQAFEDNHTLAFLLAFAAALSITVVIEIVRHVRAKRAAAELATPVDVS